MSGCTEPPPENNATEIAATGEPAADNAATGPTEAQPTGADPYGLAGKNTRQLDQLIADIKPPGTTYYNLSPEDRAYFDALVNARALRFGKNRTKAPPPDLEKAYRGAYANPGKDPNPKAAVDPIEPGGDLDAGVQP